MSDSPETDEVVEIAELDATRTSWGTIAGRVLLALLVVLLAIEAHGKFGYDRTLAALREKANKVVGDPVHGELGLEEWSLPVADAESCVSGIASKTRKTAHQIPVIELRWFSLFKTYFIQLHLDDENIVVGLSTDDGE